MAKKSKTRVHKGLYVHDSPYKHKVEPDKKKTIPRKQKNLKKIPPINYEGPWSKDLDLE